MADRLISPREFYSLPVSLRCSDVVRVTGMCRTTIYAAAERGELPAVRVGRNWLFSRDRLGEQFGIQRPEPRKTAVKGRRR